MIRHHSRHRDPDDLNHQPYEQHTFKSGDTRTKSIITAAAVLFAANLSAADIYRDLGEGNSDLATQRVSAEDFVGVQPSVGDNVSRYQGWDEGNLDLFRGDGSQSRPSTGRPDMYNGFSQNPDLRF